MKNTSAKDSKKNRQSPDKARAIIASTRPTSAALNRAIQKSIKKNKETLKILAKK